VRAELLQKTINVLEGHDFNTLVYLHSCLDVAAQKKRFLMLIKVLENIDGFRNEHAEELKRLSFYLNSYPLIIGETTKAERMSDDTLYERHGIGSITVNTLESSLAGDYPKKIYSKGRVIAHIDGSALKQYREKRKISLEELAKEINLTKESVYLYEHEKMRMKYEIARKIEEFFNRSMITTSSPFVRQEKQETKPTTELEKKLTGFEFDVYSFHKLNFDIGAKDDKDRIILSQSADNLSKTVDFSNFFKTFFAIVSDKKQRVPTIEKEEFMGAKSKKDLLKLVKEKSAVDN
jgi:predicted transcriptional regulator